MKIFEMTFDDVMRVVHRSELLFNESSVLWAMHQKTGSDEKKWIITADPEEYYHTHDVGYEISPGPKVKGRNTLFIDMYTHWYSNNMIDFSDCGEIQPTCPVGPSHQAHVRWARVKQKGATYTKNGQAVEYSADVPCVYCGHPDCNTYYIDYVGSSAIDAACIEARKRSELKSW